MPFKFHVKIPVHIQMFWWFIYFQTSCCLFYVLCKFFKFHLFDSFMINMTWLFNFHPLCSVKIFLSQTSPNQNCEMFNKPLCENCFWRIVTCFTPYGTDGCLGIKSKCLLDSLCQESTCIVTVNLCIWLFINSYMMQ